MNDSCIQQKSFYFRCPKPTNMNTMPQEFLFEEEVELTSFQKILHNIKSTLRLVGNLFFLAKKIVML